MPPRLSDAHGPKLTDRPNEAAPRVGAGRRITADSYGLFMTPAIIVTIALVVIPTCYAIWISLTDWNLTSGKSRSFIGIQNYVDLFYDTRFWSSMARTLVFAISTLALNVVLGFALALLLNRRLPGKALFRTLLIVPQVVTPVVVGLTWRFMYDPSLGIVNWVLRFFGGNSIAFLGQSGTALMAVIVTFVWEYTPFVFLILLAGLEGLPKEPFEAAKIDGASRIATHWHITIPMMKGPISVALLFQVMFSFGVFDIIYIMTGGGPGRATETLVMYAYKLGFVTFDIGHASAAALLLLGVTVGFAGVVVKSIRSREEAR